MGEFITVGAVLTIVVGILSYLAKRQFDTILTGIADNGKLTTEVKKDLECKIDGFKKEVYVELAKRDENINKVETELSQLKADLPMVYTLREDFIRTLNNVDNKMGTIENKIDKLLQK